MRPIEDYRREYGDTHNGFAQDGDGDDWLPAFRRAMEEHRNPNIADDWRRFRTYRTTILLGPRTYRMSGPLELDRALTIRGEGTRSELFFDAGTDGVTMHFLEYSGTPGTSPSGYGGASLLEDLTIRGTDAAGTVGVRMHIGGEARGVEVHRFGWHAWLIDADARRPARSNANGWVLLDCSAFGCGRNPGAGADGAPRLPGCGLRIDGGDTNVGYSRTFRARNCGGWGIDDSSFLGNTHVQPQSDGCGNMPDAAAPYDGPLAYRSEGRNQRTVWLNPYVEGHALCVISDPAIRIGGLGGRMQPGSHWMRGRTFEGQWEFAGYDQTELFEADPSLAAELDREDGTALQDAFSAHQLTLSAGSEVTVLVRGQRWSVVDRTAHQSYSVERLASGALRVARSNRYDVELGGGATLLQFGASADSQSHPYRLKYITERTLGRRAPHTGFYRLDYGNLNSAVALLLTGAESLAPDGRKLEPGRMVLPEHYVGPAMVREAYGRQPPVPIAESDWPVGSRYWNIAPTVGEPIGWVVVEEQGQPIWRRFGMVE